MEPFLSDQLPRDALRDTSFLAALLRYEAALSRAQANAGVIPLAAAQSIAGTCKVELFDVSKIVRESHRLGDMELAMVESLKETVGIFNPAACAYVHYGCSAQDGLQTAKALASRVLLTEIFAALDKALSRLHELTQRYAADPVLERVHMQPVGVRSAGSMFHQWAARLMRSRTALCARAEQALRVHWGGADATLPGAMSNAQATQVLQVLAETLELPAAAVGLQLGSDDWAALACEVGLLGRALGAMGADLMCMAQVELAECTESTGDARQTSTSSAPFHAVCRQLIANGQRMPQRLATQMASSCQTGPAADWALELSQWSDFLVSVWESVDAGEQLLQRVALDAKRMRLNAEVWLRQTERKGPSERASFEQAKVLAQRLRSQVGGK